MVKSEKIWINEGYLVFAKKGPEANKIERLAKSLGRNKSSFYYYFATQDIFTGELVSSHLIRIRLMAEKIQKIIKREDLIKILLQHHIDLLFNKQLRIHRINSQFENCVVKTNELVRDAIMPIWKNIIGLQNQPYLARLVLRLSAENFFLRITEDNFNALWLQNYFNELAQLIRELKK